MEEVNVKRSTGSKRTAVIRSNWHDDLTENTTESTTDIKTSCPVARNQTNRSGRSRSGSFQSGNNSTYGSGEGRTKTTLGYIRGKLAEDDSPET
jgi:hypothetical protein